MTLYASWVAFVDEVDVVTAHLRGYAASGTAITSSANFSFRDECLLEGVLSRGWQAWCNFCRSCVIKSCLGTTDGAGNVVAAHHLAISEGHVSAACIAAKERRPSPHYWGGSNALLRREPTWGDVDILVRVLPRIAPSNEAQLVAALSGCSASAKSLQIIRNASAHENHQSFTEVQNLRSRYVTFPITHPVQAMYWTDPSTSNFLAIAAFDDLVDGALSAIS